MHERTRVVNRLHKVLEDAGVKLATVASDIVGVSGRAMLTALAGGTTDPAVLADLARGRLRQKLPALREALRGRFVGHHRLLVSQALEASRPSRRDGVDAECRDRGAAAPFCGGPPAGGDDPGLR
jgi:hypothetical protein